MAYFLALTTIGSDAEAAKLARALVESRLVACVNIQSGLRSIYRWDGGVHDEPECLLIMKTREDCLPKLEQRLLAEHPYDVPEFLVVPVDRGSLPYLQWIDHCLAAE